LLGSQRTGIDPVVEGGFRQPRQRVGLLLGPAA
jgi:hypothetical protein